MIKDKVSSLQSQLLILKKSYNDLVTRIKEVFYEKEDYWVENSPRKPRTDSARMGAAYALLSGKCPQYSFDYGINKAEVWKSNPKQYIEKWCLYDERFETTRGTSPVIFLYKKNIKLLDELCLKVWIKEVSVDRMRPNTLLGFNDWLEQTSDDDILTLMQEYYDDRVFLINDKKLYLKDIVIVYPHSLKISGNRF